MNPQPYGNVFAPVAYNGVEQLPGEETAPFDYIYDVTMTANQALLDQTVSIDTDADFELRGVMLTVNTGAFSVRWSDGQGYYLSNAQLVNNNFNNQVPYPVFPSLVIPAGGRIGVDITNLTGAGNTIQLVFRGVKRYKPSSC